MTAVQALDRVAKSLLERNEELTGIALEQVAHSAPAYVRAAVRAGQSVEDLVRATVTVLCEALVRPDLLKNAELTIRANAGRRAAEGIPLESLLEVIAIQRRVVMTEFERLAGPEWAGAVLLGERRLERAYTQLVMGITSGYLESVQEIASERNDALESLVLISRAINRALDVADVAGSGLGETVKAMAADGGAVYLQSPGGLALSHSTGYTWKEDLDLRDSRSHWLVAKAADSAGPVQTGQSPERPLPVEGVSSAVAAPLRFQGEVLGVLTVVSRTPRRFQPAELTFLVAVADHMAVALARAFQHRLEARTDFLTGLANRPEFARAMERAVASAERHQRPLTLAVFDVDVLKEINDGWGHHAGDRAIRAVADVLRSVVRASDTCARLGGDEFALAMPETGHLEAEEVLRRIRRALRQRAVRMPFPLEVSVGMATWERGMTGERLFKLADARLYQEKRKHRAEREAAVR